MVPILGRPRRAIVVVVVVASVSAAAAAAASSEPSGHPSSGGGGDDAGGAQQIPYTSASSMPEYGDADADADADATAASRTIPLMKIFPATKGGPGGVVVVEIIDASDARAA